MRGCDVPLARIRIAAPVSSVADADAVLAAGADELYCGWLPEEWIARFGQGDVLTRRQSRHAHAGTGGEMAGILGLARRANVPVALVLNGRYTRAQIAPIRRILDAWQNLGGRRVIVADLGLLMTLRRHYPLQSPHLSLLAGVFNGAAAAFFAGLGAQRIVLPRDLSLAEIRATVAGAPNLEYEAVALHQKCPFMDGMCRFRHDTHLPRGVPAAFRYAASPPRVGLEDPDYEGHGCQLAYWSARGPVRLPACGTPDAPPCAACVIAALRACGVTRLKIAARGYPADAVVRGVRFLKRVAAVSASAGPASAARRRIRRVYRATFGVPCDRTRCYYPVGRT
jgi:putative protease